MVGTLDQIIASIAKDHAQGLSPAQQEYLKNLQENQKTVKERVAGYLSGSFPKEWTSDKGALSHKLISALARVNEYSSLIIEGIGGPVSDQAKAEFKKVHQESKNLELLLRGHINSKFG